MTLKELKDILNSTGDKSDDLPVFFYDDTGQINAINDVDLTLTDRIDLQS